MQRRTYGDEKREDYFIVNKHHKTSAAAYVRHDFFPDQMYLTFRIHEFSEGLRQ